MTVGEIAVSLLKFFDENLVIFFSFVFALFLVELLGAGIEKIFKMHGRGKVSLFGKFSDREIGLFGYILYVVFVGVSGVFIQIKLGEYMISYRQYLSTIISGLVLLTYIFALRRVGYTNLKKYDFTILGLFFLIAIVGYYYGNKWSLVMFVFGLIACYRRPDIFIFD